ncbi:MAG: choice-of-anchor D domain-containing protein [Bacteroidota bacterium]|nr:choice-of-anchor D domain-containing protein [Bacteroidota bacterium]
MIHKLFKRLEIGQYTSQAFCWIFLGLLVVVSLSCNDGEIPDSSQPHIQIVVDKAEVNFEVADTNEKLDKSIIITNSFSFTRSLDIKISINGNGFAFVSGGGSFSLSPGGSRTVVVRYSPSVSGSSSGTLTITHNALNTTSPIIIPLRANPQTPEQSGVYVSTTSLAYGIVENGQSSTLNVTITNSSNSTETYSGNITIIGSGFSITTGGGTYSLSPGKSRIVTVRFSPLSNTSYTGTLTITHNASNTSSPINVPLTGNTQTTINMQITPTSIDFGTIMLGESSEENIVIQNLSSSSGALNGSVSLSASGFSITTGSGSFSLAPGESKSVSVKFSAYSRGSYSGAVRISHNATNISNPVFVSIKGYLMIALNLSVNPASLNFGSVPVGQASDQTLTIDNSSGSTGSISGNISISGRGFSIQSNGGLFNLSVGQSRSLTVRFLPSSSGNFSGSVLIYHNATNISSPIIIHLSGSGQLSTSGGIYITPSSLSYGTLTMGQSADQYFTISNLSTSSEVITGTVIPGTSGGGFSIISGGGVYSLPPGQSKTVIIRFSPLMVGIHAGAADVYHNAQNTTNPFSVLLQGFGK